MPEPRDGTNAVRSIVAKHGRLKVDVAGLGDREDLYRAGLTSHACVAVMLACEDEFDVEFTDDLVARSTFSTLASLTAALHALGAELSDDPQPTR